MRFARANAGRPARSWDGRFDLSSAVEEGGVDSPDGPRSKRRGFVWTLLEVLLIVAVAFGIAMLVQAFLLKPYAVHQESMEPTLREGDRILLSRLTYHFREPRAGDVVVFNSPFDEEDDLVKRVVAVAGDRVAVRAGDLYVNGSVVVEPYLADQDFAGEMAEQVVPTGDVFVMGDNRDVSGDSRAFGPVSTEDIIGEALCVYWPIGRWRGL